MARLPLPLPVQLLPTRAHPAPGARCARRADGFALVEVTLALLVIAVATLGSVSWTLSGMGLEASNRETAEGNKVLRGVLEELQEVPLDEVFRRFNTIAADDPDGSGTARGALFTVEATRKQDFLAADGPAGLGTVAYRQNPIEVSIAFPVDGAGALLESAQGTTWGDRAWDLDGDGEISTTPITTYTVLPVRVRIRWSGVRGTRLLEHVRLLTHRIRTGEDD